MKLSEKYAALMLAVSVLENEISDSRMAAELVWTTGTQEEYYEASMAFRRKLSDLGDRCREAYRALAAKEVDHEHA